MRKVLPFLLEKSKWKSLSSYLLYHLVHTGREEDSLAVQVGSCIGTLLKISIDLSSARRV